MGIKVPALPYNSLTKAVFLSNDSANVSNIDTTGSLRAFVEVAYLTHHGPNMNYRPYAVVKGRIKNVTLDQMVSVGVSDLNFESLPQSGGSTQFGLTYEFTDGQLAALVSKGYFNKGFETFPSSLIGTEWEIPVEIKMQIVEPRFEDEPPVVFAMIENQYNIETGAELFNLVDYFQVVEPSPEPVVKDGEKDFNVEVQPNQDVEQLLNEVTTRLYEDAVKQEYEEQLEKEAKNEQNAKENDEKLDLNELNEKIQEKLQALDQYAEEESDDIAEQWRERQVSDVLKENEDAGRTEFDDALDEVEKEHEENIAIPHDDNLDEVMQIARDAQKQVVENEELRRKRVLERLASIDDDELYEGKQDDGLSL